MYSIPIYWCSTLVFVRLIALAMAIFTAPSSQRPAVNADNPVTIEDFKAGDEGREPHQRATDIVKAMEIARGDWVADVGAGAGYYSMRLSDLVGPGGKVFAEDISDTSIRWLNQRVKVFGLQNIAVVKGEANNPELPAEKLSAVLIVDSYHHFVQYQSMMERILRALKPGGRLVIADYSLPEHRTQSRADQLKIHEIDPSLVQKEIEQIGFREVRREDPFVKRNPTAKSDLWLMAAIRPQ